MHFPKANIFLRFHDGNLHKAFHKSVNEDLFLYLSVSQYSSKPQYKDKWDISDRAKSVSKETSQHFQLLKKQS